MVLHKSRKFCTILDLSFQLRHKGTLLPSVNSGTVKLAPEEAMVQLGNCMKRIVSTMADNIDPAHPFVFAKVDIKDGFWRLRVSDEDAWNFCYTMPQVGNNTDVDDLDIVVPISLQMGWCESPPLFCAVTETAQDVIQSLMEKNALPSHKFKYQMMDKVHNWNRLQAAAQATNLMEVFVNDFIAVTNDRSQEHLFKFSNAILYGIHLVFPPPEVSGHQGEDPILQKKMHQGDGSWDTIKEILGWIVDGANFTIQLPPSKCEKITMQIKSIRKMKVCPLQKYQELSSKLQHASFAIPGGKGLLSPIYRALAGTPPFITITDILKQTLLDWRAVVKHLAKTPTHVSILVPQHPNFLQYTDACWLGAGGIICPGTDMVPYTIWQFAWPEDIKAAFDNNKLTINDLELAGMVLRWLVLKYVVQELDYKHVGLFCNNVSAVSWAQKGHTTTSIPAARLLHFVSLRQCARQASCLLPLHIAGEQNEMADICSRAFKHGKFHMTNSTLLSFFRTNFSLPQNHSWTEWKVHKKLSSRVISCLRGKQLQMESLLNLPRLGKNIGSTGSRTPTSSKQIPISKESQNWTNQSSSQGTLHGSGQALLEWEMKSKFNQLLMPWRPSPRPSNWQENAVQSTRTMKHTSCQSKDALKASEGRTPRPSHS